MRTNFRFIARAIDWPSEVLPTPGGPTKQRIGPFMRATLAAVRRARLGAGAANVAVDGSAGGAAGVCARDGSPCDCRSFCTARYSTMRSLTLSRS